MKNLFFIIALLLAPVFASAQAIVENPDFYGRNNKIVKIDRVETTDTETVLHITLTSPNSSMSIRLASAAYLKDSATDRVFRLREAVGFDLDKFQKLRNNTASIKLVFDRLPDDVSRVDFVEGNTSGDFRVCGIQVKWTPYQELIMGTDNQYKYYRDTHTLVLRGEGENNISIPVTDGKDGITMKVIYVKHMY